MLRWLVLARTHGFVSCLASGSRWEREAPLQRCEGGEFYT